MEKGLIEKTGKGLDHWIDVVKKSGKEKHMAIVDYLKTEHAFSHGFANFVAHAANQSAAASFDDDALLIGQYKGKEDLRPIYDKLNSEIRKLGNDIAVTPKKDSVSFIRKKQFALIKPASKTRIDLGLKFKAQEPTGILENSGPFGAMCTNRIQIHTLDSINAEVLKWIKAAYEESV
ncbi:MAG TPA: DUF4287 domain-containing protein [Bacteroidetes bacterium]|nr:DUF4287 domain-containing protein [Bacteroidota bacterium]